MGRSRTRSQSGNPTVEYAFLKENNSQLAKALAEAQVSYKHMMDERNFIRNELFNAKVRIEQLENYIGNINVSARESVNCIVALSNHATKILEFVSYARNAKINMPFNNLNASLNKSNSCSVNKTQAVKPMIDGHVIYSPTINLKRVNENAFSQIQSRRGTNRQNIEAVYNDNNEEGNNLSPNESFEQLSSGNRRSYGHRPERLAHDQADNDLESDDDNSEESAHPGDIQLSINNIGLTTIEEEEMEGNLSLSSRRNSNNRSCTLPGSAGQMPILSGVFRDVRVYLPPVDPLLHITKVRGSSKSHKFKNSDVQLNRSSEAGPSTDNINVHDRTQQENVEPNCSSNAFDKATCSSTPITSFIYNQSSSTANDANSNAESNSASMHIKKRRKTRDHTNPKKLIFNRSLQSSNSRSYVSDDDPLEGPSSLLETTDVNKLFTLSQLGLSPISAPASPSRSEEKKQKSRELEMLHKDILQRNYPIKRKIEKKRNTVVSSKVTKREVSKYSSSPQSSPTRKYSKRSTRFASDKSKRVTLQTSPEGNNSTFSTKSSISPRTGSRSPLKGKRPRRAASKENYKEPSLHKKLRRSK